MKYNFNIDAINDIQNSLSKSEYNSITQKKLIELNEYIVDLGLPSGTLWCKYNLGCNFKQLSNYSEYTKPKDWHGKYYAWGELKQHWGFQAVKKNQYNWESYKYANNTDHQLTKYCNQKNYGNNKFVDNLMQLQLEDDAAYQNLCTYSFKFCMPSKEQFEELINYTTNETISNYKDVQGLRGKVFKGTNGIEIFFPGAGQIVGDHILEGYGKYWTKDLYDIIPSTAFALECSFEPKVLTYNRDNGFSIKPILLQ